MAQSEKKQRAQRRNWRIYKVAGMISALESLACDFETPEETVGDIYAAVKTLEGILYKLKKAP